MKKILVPTDFTPLSEHALSFACQIALQMKYEIFLLSVQSLPANDDANMAIELIKTIQEASEEKLNIAADKTREAHKGVHLTTHFAFGIPAMTVKEFLESGEFDLVVMGTKGSHGVDRLLFGSVAESVSKHSPCPVIIVHADTVYKPVKHIAVPIDINYKFGESHHVIHKIVELAEVFKAELSWFYVNTNKDHKQDDIYYMLEAGKKIDIEIINAPTVEKGIATYCDASANDLLIIIKRDYSLVQQLFQRNIFAEILQKQSLPIMVVHY